MELSWTYKTFEELTTTELYTVLHLRMEVFILEQQCIYSDIDHKDQKSRHLMAWDGAELVAYTRILPPGVSFKETSIGRVLTSPRYRRLGVGITLMEKSIAAAYESFGKNPIRIGAQLYLRQFYESFGFIAQGDEFLEDDIPHIEMLLTPNRN